jgi:glycosyltransferase involved in cell wall biosynthesis
LKKIEREIPDYVPVFTLKLQNPLQMLAAAELARILRRERIDILHSHLFYGSRYASPIGWACRVPVVIETPHLRESWRTGWKANFAIDRSMATFVNYYVAVSHANADYLKNVKGIPADKVVVIQNGCDTARFNSSEIDTSLIRTRLGLSGSDPVLVVPARLEPQKGHFVLLDALPDILNEFPSARVLFVGDGSLRKQLESAALRRGLNNSIRFVGYQTNIEEWLAAGDLTVLPSLYEGLPLVAMESLAARRPLVATCVDGTPEVVVDGYTGLTVPPNNSARLAEAIRSLLRDSELRQRFGRCGRQHVLRHFTQQLQIQRTQDLYRRSLEEFDYGRTMRVTTCTFQPGRSNEQPTGRHR